MKKASLTVVALALIWMTSGCATVQIAKNFGDVTTDGASKPVATVAAENYGYYLFGVIPLITGAPAYPNAYMCCLLQDTVTLQGNMAMVSQYAKAEHGKKLASVKTIEDWTGSFSFWIIWRKIIFTSALITE